MMIINVFCDACKVKIDQQPIVLATETEEIHLCSYQCVMQAAKERGTQSDS